MENGDAGQKKKKTAIVALLLLCLFASFLPLMLRYVRERSIVGTLGKTSANMTEAKEAPAVVIEADGEEILRAPLDVDARYMIKDGKAELLRDDTVTLSTILETVPTALHDVNIVEIRDGVVSCAESNCDNQICVHTAAITGAALDLPIVCLPHKLAISVIGGH